MWDLHHTNSIGKCRLRVCSGQKWGSANVGPSPHEFDWKMPIACMQRSKMGIRKCGTFTTRIRLENADCVYAAVKNGDPQMWDLHHTNSVGRCRLRVCSSQKWGSANVGPSPHEFGWKMPIACMQQSKMGIRKCGTFTTRIRLEDADCVYAAVKNGDPQMWDLHHT